MRLELPALYVDDVVARAAVRRPVLINRDPGPDERDVPLAATIALEILDPGPDGIERGSSRVWVNGALAFVGGAVPEVQAGFDGPASLITETTDTLRIVLDPLVPFASEAIVEVRVASATAGGKNTLDEAYTFAIEDRTAPRLVAAQAIAPRVLRLGFDEAVTVAAPAGFAFEHLGGHLGIPAVPLVASAAEASGTLVTVVLATEMTPATRYRVTVTGVTDLNDNPARPPSNSIVFTGYQPPRLAARRFDLWSMLPKHNRRDDATGGLRRFIACLQEVLDLLLAEVDRFPDIFDIERAPAPFLDIILRDLGNPFGPILGDLTDLEKRRLASVLVIMYRQKGTAVGIRNAIRFFLGIDITAIPMFASTGLVLGESELGVDWELGPADRFARYAFNIEVGTALTGTQRRHIRTIVNYLKPAHTHFVHLVEPGPPPAFDHWELGVSELGITTDLHG